MRQTLLTFFYSLVAIGSIFFVYGLVWQTQQNIWTRRAKKTIKKSLEREDILPVEMKCIGRCISTDDPFEKSRRLVIDAKFVIETSNTYLKYIYVDLDNYGFIQKVRRNTYTKILYNDDKFEEHKFKF